jgi:molybdate transport system ATP-binding protein
VIEVDVEAGRGAFRLAVAFSAAPGEVVAVLGPNGAGKSTLLDVLAGLVRPERGRLVVGGRTLVGEATHVPPHRRSVGLLSQDPLLFPHLTALGNVAFGPRARGQRRRVAEARARALLSEVDAADLADRRPRALSGGQQQRVALARALATDPALLLLDEPFAALDVDAAPALRGLVRRVLRANPRTQVVLVTHDPLDALVLADRVLVLDRGRIVEQGPTKTVLSAPRTPFTARIAGLDLVAGLAHPDGVLTPDGTVVTGVRGEDVVDGEPAVAVFRPAAVAVHIERPHGSPRNVFPATVAAMEPHGDVVRVRAGGPGWVAGLTADLTPAAVADLLLTPGDEVFLAVKAAEVDVHGTAATMGAWPNRASGPT